MKNENIFNAVGRISDELIEDAAITTGKKNHTVVCVRWAAMAACLCLVSAFIITRLQNNHVVPDSQLSDNPSISIEQPNPTHQDTDKTDPNIGSEIDKPIIWGNAYGEVQDAGFTEWNGKTITLSLYDVLSDEKNKDSLIAVSVGFEIDTNFVYNGKSLAEYAMEADNERLGYGKLGQLLKLGDSLKYGEALFTTGTPTGEKWTKELYDETIETIGEDLIAKYIVDGVFLKENLETDIAEYRDPGPCQMAYEEVRNAFHKASVDGAIKQLEKQNINYERRNETTLVFFVTADEFTFLSLDNVLHFGLALKDDQGMDMAENSADDFMLP